MDKLVALGTQAEGASAGRGPGRSWMRRAAWASIGVCGLLGGLLGGLLPVFLQPLPNPRFAAETEIKVDPADEAALTAAAVAMRSKASLDNLVQALNLSHAKGFAPGSPGFLEVFYDIVTGGGTTVSQAEEAVRQRLAEAIAVEARKGGVVRIGATLEAREDAARLVQRLNAMFVETLTSHAGTPRPVLDALRQAMERAEAALVGFLGQNGEQRAAALRQFRSDRETLARQIAQTEADLEALREKQSRASAMTLADVLAKPLPDSLEFTGLDYQRQRHVQASLAVDQLSASLGPRHPRLLAAQAALDDIGRDIQQAIRQLSASLQRQQAETARQLADLTSRRDRLAADKDMAAASERLAALETAASDARENYLQGKQNESRLPAKSGGPAVQVVKPLTVVAVTGSGGIPWAWCAAGGGFGLLAPSLFLLHRRRSDHVVDDDEEQAMELDRDLDWLEDLDLLADHGPEIDAPERDAGQEERLDKAAPARVPFVAANDRSLVDQINDVLMANRRTQAQAALPPLVAAASRARLSSAGMGSTDNRHGELSEEPESAELDMLRRDMARLREKVMIHAGRRQAARG